MSLSDSDSRLAEPLLTESTDSDLPGHHSTESTDSDLPERSSIESITSESDLPEYPFTEEERRYLRIVGETTPLSDIIRAQALRPQRPPRRHYLHRLPSISESISVSQYSAVTDYCERAPIARSQSITLPDPIQDYFVPTTNPPSLPGDKVKTRTKFYKGLARFFNQSTTSLAELSSATKEKIKDFKLARSKSTFNLPGLVSPLPSPSSSTTTLPPRPRISSSKLRGFANRVTIKMDQGSPQSPRVHFVPQEQEELSGNKSRRTRVSSGHWISPHRPGRSTTDANGSPAASRLHAMNVSKVSSSPQSSQNYDPITPPPPSLQSPHVFKPVIDPSTPNESSHLFKPVKPVASSTSKSTHNFKPVIDNKSRSPNSQHNFKPVIINKSPPSESSHNFKPVTITKSQSPKTPHNFKPIIVDDLATPISPHTFTPLQAAPSPSLHSFFKSKNDVYADADINAGFSFCVPASTSVQFEPSPVAPEPSSPGAEPDWKNYPFKTRYKPYVPRPYDPDEEVTFPNGLDGDNPYLRPYGGGWRNHPYHLYERLTTDQLLVDPYAKPPKSPKKKSSRNYYGGRSAAQRESTRYVHRASNGELHEAYEMDDLSAPKSGPSNDVSKVAPEAAPDDPPKPFVGTAATILQRVREDLRIQNVQAHDPASNVYFYEKSYVPRFTKHSLRPSKRPFSIRNFFSRRLYGRPGDGANLLMPHIPYTVKIPGVDDREEKKAAAEAEAEAEAKKNEPLFGHRDYLDDEWKAQLKEAQAARKARHKKRARERKKKEKELKKARGPFYSFRQRREKKKLAKAKKNYEKELEEEARKKMKAPEPSSPLDLFKEHESVVRHDFAQKTSEQQRAVALEEARRGKKKASFDGPILNSMAESDDLRRDVLHGHDLSVANIHATSLSADAATTAIVPRFYVNAPSIDNHISRRDKANHQEMAQETLLLPDEIGVWKTNEHQSRESDYAKIEKARLRKLRAEKKLAEQLPKNQESTPEKPLQPTPAKTPKSIAKESLRVSVSPPLIRTPDRYKGYTFEEAEQLVTPNSPQQCQFEADQAGPPRAPTPYHFPYVEEEFDAEYEKQIADLSNTFREFL